VYRLGLHPAEVDRTSPDDLELMLAGWRWRFNQDARVIAGALAVLLQPLVSMASRDAAQAITAERLETCLRRFREADPFASEPVDPDLVRGPDEM